MKVAILQETLERAGLTALPAIQAHTGEPWAYRNRTRLRIAELEATLRVGYNRRGSNEFLAIHECPISAPLLWRAAEALLKMAAENSTPDAGFALRSRSSSSPRRDEKKLQMTLFVRKAQPGFAAFCERMQELVPELAGADVSLLPSSGPQRRARKPRPLESWGADGLNYPAAGEGYWVSRGGFFQVNRFLVDELVRIVTAGRQGTIAWDLYAGVGLFSRALARAFQQVVAVEAAANDLSKVLQGAGQACCGSHDRRVFAKRSRTARATGSHRDGPSQSRRRRRGLRLVGADFFAGDRLRLLRSCDPGARPEVAGRGGLQHRGDSHGRHVSTDVSSGDGHDFAQVIVVALW